MEFRKAVFSGRAVLALFLVALVTACSGGDFSSTSPNLSAPVPSSAAASVVTGTVDSADGDAQGIRVSVVGSSGSDRTDRRGRFRLPGVPAGDVTLEFQRSDLDAQVRLIGIGQGQHVRVRISLGGQQAELTSSETEGLVEFEGIVLSADATAGTLSLDDGQTIVVSPHPTTWWDSGGDLMDFGSLEAALAGGQTVRAEGSGAVDDTTGEVIASAIKVETEEDEAVEAEFEGLVTVVNLTDGTFAVDDGTVAVVDGATIFASGGLTGLTEISDARDAGHVVRVEGEGVLQEDGTVLAESVEAELEEADFDGIATSANGDTFEVDGVTQVHVDVETVWTGELTSVQQIADALASGSTVEVDGEGLLHDDGSIHSTSVDAAIDEEDGDDDSSDDASDEGESPDYTTQIAALEQLIDLTETTAATEGLDEDDFDSLIVSLERAIESLERGNGTPAANQIGAYINKLRALVRSGRLDEDAAETLEETAEDIIDAIETAG